MKGGGCAGRENGAGVFDGFRFAFEAAVWRRRERHGGGRRPSAVRQTAPAVDAVRGARRARAQKEIRYRVLRSSRLHRFENRNENPFAPRMIPPGDPVEAKRL